MAINAAISEVTKTKRSAHWIELFEGAGIPCGPINTIDQVFADPQVQHLGLSTPVQHRRLGRTNLVASPVNIEGVSKAIRTATPEKGEHTASVLAGLGYGEAEIEGLRAAGAL